MTGPPRKRAGTWPWGRQPSTHCPKVCFYCGATNVVTAERLLREPTQAEMQVFESIPELVRARRALLISIEMHRRGRKKGS